MKILLKKKKKIHYLLAHPKFRAAYDFLLLRAQAGEPVKELAEWWTRFQNLDGEASLFPVGTAVSFLQFRPRLHILFEILGIAGAVTFMELLGHLFDDVRVK